MNRQEFLDKFFVVATPEGENVWESAVAVRMESVNNPEAVLCTLVEEPDGKTVLYPEELEAGRLGFVLVYPGDDIIPPEGIIWESGTDEEAKDTDGSTEQEGTTEEDHQNTQGDQETTNQSQESTETESSEEQPTQQVYSEPESGVETGNPQSDIREVTNEQTEFAAFTGTRIISGPLDYEYSTDVDDEVFSFDAISSILSETDNLEEDEKDNFLTQLEDRNASSIMELRNIANREDFTPEEVEVIDNGKISEVVTFLQDKHGVDVIPRSITHIPEKVILKNHKQFVENGEIYYYSRDPKRSAERVESFIEKALDAIRTGEQIAEPVTVVLQTLAGEVRTFRYFQSEIREIAARLSKYNPKLVRTEGTYLLVVGQYWGI